VLLLAGALPGSARGQTTAGVTLLFGGSADDVVFDSATDSQGNIYVVGETKSSDFPVVGGVQSERKGSGDAFVVKLNPTGTDVIYATYLGGSGFDSARGVAVDGAGTVFVTGYTDSSDFPLVNALDATRSGSSDAFVTRLNAAGTDILFSTYFGGPDADNGERIAVGAGGSVYVAGRTYGGLAPLSAAQATYGGNGDAFVAKINAALQGFSYVTYLGGGQIEIANALAVDPAGRACVAGQTASSDFPTANAPQPVSGGSLDGFWALLSPEGAQVLASSFIGGAGSDRARGVSCTSSKVAVVGDTSSADFPTGATPGAPIQSVLGGQVDAFLGVFDVSALPSVTREGATLIGGRRTDSIADAFFRGNGDLTIFGDTDSNGLPEDAATPRGLPGAGLFRSADGGRTWSSLGLAGIGINQVARVATAPGRVLAATDSGLYVSADEGATWTRQSGLASRVTHAVAIHPGNPCTWVIGIDAAPGDQTPVAGARTTDCGSSWSSWGMAASRFLSLHWLGDPDRLVATVEREEDAGEGTPDDTCVMNAEGQLRRCFSRGTGDNVIAPDLTASCRWVEGDRFGVVRQVSGNAFGCDHPFNDLSTGANFGAAVTALSVSSPNAGQPEVWAGTGNGNVWWLAGPGGGGWKPTALPVKNQVTSVVGTGVGRALASAGSGFFEVHADTQSTASLATETGASGFGGLLGVGGDLLGGALAQRALFWKTAPTGAFFGLGLGFSISGTPGADEAAAATPAASGDGAIAFAFSAIDPQYTLLPLEGAPGGKVAAVGRAGLGDLIPPREVTFAPEGGSITHELVRLPVEVEYEDPANAGWLSFTEFGLNPSASGVVLTAEPNLSSSPRRATVRFAAAVSGATTVVEVTQEGLLPRCAAPPVLTTLSVGGAGGLINIVVVAPDGCSHTTRADDFAILGINFSSLTTSDGVAGTSGCPGCAQEADRARVSAPVELAASGSGTVSFLVAPTPGPGRVFHLIVAGYGVTVVQGPAASAVTSRAFLAEGATSAFFDTEVAVVNPSVDKAVVATATFDTAQGQSVSESKLVWPMGRVTFDPKSLAGLEAAEFATAIAADGLVVAARVMTWDATGYGSHAEAGLPGPALTWYLAEGATHSGFQLFYLLYNPGAQDTVARVQYLRPAPAPPIERSYSVPARTRVNVWVNQEGSELAATDVSAVVTSAGGVPIVVERAMYFDRAGRLFDAGHESAGITAPALEWFLAEGATGPYFDEFVLLANPGDSAAEVTAQFLMPSGATLTRDYTVAPRSRFTVWVDHQAPELASTAVSVRVTVTNGVPVIVERAMWWPGDVGTWHEAHNSAGATGAGPRWAVAAGQAGGASGQETYVLIANVSAWDGLARVTVLFEDGAAPESATVAVAGTSRTNVPIGQVFPAALGRRFGVLVESLGEAPAHLVVEGAIYANSGGVEWAAGAALLATPLP
jgi:hypothetical protein